MRYILSNFSLKFLKDVRKAQLKSWRWCLKTSEFTKIFLKKCRYQRVQELFRILAAMEPLLIKKNFLKKFSENSLNNVLLYEICNSDAFFSSNIDNSPITYARVPNFNNLSCWAPRLKNQLSIVWFSPVHFKDHHLQRYQDNKRQYKLCEFHSFIDYSQCVKQLYDRRKKI